MGRDKPKKYNKMGYFEKARYDDKLANKYNINKDDYTQERAGGGRYDFVDNDAYKKAIKNAMRNDFDYRTSAQHMDGVDGKANFNDFAKYERGAVKLHKQAGNGGEFSSNKDITGVTNRLVNEYRDGIQDQISDMSASAQKKDAEEVVLSDRLQEDRDYVEKIDNKDYDIFNRNINNGDNQSQRETAADAFLNKFKAGVKSDFNLKPVLPI